MQSAELFRPFCVILTLSEVEGEESVSPVPRVILSVVKNPFPRKRSMILWKEHLLP